MHSKKNVLLTGATGFIGSYLLADLLENKDIGRIYILSRKVDKNNEKERLFTAFEKFSVPGHEQLAAATNISVIEGDITQPRLVYPMQLLKNSVQRWMLFTILRHVSITSDHMKC